MSSDHFQISPDSFYEGVRLARVEDLSRVEYDVDFALVDVGPNVREFSFGHTSTRIVPVLIQDAKPAPTDWSVAVDEYRARAAHAQSLGCSTIVLGADNDGLLHWLLSPRHHGDWPLAERLAIVVDILKAIRAHIPNCGVALTVEELCPGGLDPTEGIAIALALEAAGASFMVASGGTVDFPALKMRRPTKKKNEAAELFVDENEVYMASAVWLTGPLSIPVFAQGPVQNHQNARKRALECGLSGLIDTPVAIES